MQVFVGKSGMGLREQCKALIEAACIAYKGAFTEPQKRPRAPLTREQIQERHRQRQLRILQELKNRMGDA